MINFVINTVIIGLYPYLDLFLHHRASYVSFTIVDLVVLTSPQFMGSPCSCRKFQKSVIQMLVETNTPQVRSFQDSDSLQPSRNF